MLYSCVAEYHRQIYVERDVALSSNLRHTEADARSLALELFRVKWPSAATLLYLNLRPLNPVPPDLKPLNPTSGLSKMLLW